MIADDTALVDRRKKLYSLATEIVSVEEESGEFVWQREKRSDTTWRGT